MHEGEEERLKLIGISSERLLRRAGWVLGNCREGNEAKGM